MVKIDPTEEYGDLDLSEATRKFIEQREAAAAPAQVQTKPRWFELDRFAAYRDLPLVVGFVSVIAGVAMWTVPGALVVAGVGLMVVSWMMSQ